MLKTVESEKSVIFVVKILLSQINIFDLFLIKVTKNGRKSSCFNNKTTKNLEFIIVKIRKNC